LASVGSFQIAVGRADDNWQFTRSLWTASERFKIPLPKATISDKDHTAGSSKLSLPYQPSAPMLTALERRSRLANKDSRLMITSREPATSNPIAVSLALIICIIALIIPFTCTIAKALNKPKPGKSDLSI
jgi:hypothetical protein